MSSFLSPESLPRRPARRRFA